MCLCVPQRERVGALHHAKRRRRASVGECTARPARDTFHLSTAVFLDAVAVKECAGRLRNGRRVTQPPSSVFSLRHAFINSITAHVWEAVPACPHSRAPRYIFHPRRSLRAYSHDQARIMPRPPPVRNLSTRNSSLCLCSSGVRRSRSRPLRINSFEVFLTSFNWMTPLP